MRLDISVSKVKQTSVEGLIPYLRGPTEVNRVKGRAGLRTEHQYRFYTWLSNQINNSLFLDLGTRKGTSAVAFADNKSNKVITFDNRFFDFSEFWKGRNNLEYRHEDVMDIPDSFFDNADIIHMDLWHTGDPERELLVKLDNSQFSGILIMDDIWSPTKFPDMMEVYQEISIPKIVLPMDIGHFTGTGVVSYGDHEISIKF